MTHSSLALMFVYCDTVLPKYQSETVLLVFRQIFTISKIVLVIVVYLIVIYVYIL